MSIDIHEAVKAIRDMLPIIDPEEDYLTIMATEKKISAMEAKRKEELETAQVSMKALLKTLEAARISSTRPASVPSAEAHAAALSELDATKLSLGKSISDLEGLVASREAELASLKDEARELEEYDPAYEHQKELDGTALRLQMYKKLGFEPILDDNGTVGKMLVRSQSGDLHIVPIDGSKSDVALSQQIWKLALS